MTVDVHLVLTLIVARAVVMTDGLTVHAKTADGAIEMEKRIDARVVAIASLGTVAARLERRIVVDGSPVEILGAPLVNVGIETSAPPHRVRDPADPVGRAIVLRLLPAVVIARAHAAPRVSIGTYPAREARALIPETASVALRKIVTETGIVRERGAIDLESTLHG
jgi:hypothetical protein